MSLYKISSQFTDFVNARSKNPQKVIEQVVDAIEDLNDKGVPVPGGADALAAFHEGSDATDDLILSLLSGSPEMKKRTLKGMYSVMGELIRTGKIDGITKRIIETFLKTDWDNKVDAVAPGGPEDVMKPVKRLHHEMPSEVHIPDTDYVPPWQRREDRLIENIDRHRAASFCEVLHAQGILELVPDIAERSARLEERKYQWASLLK